MEESPKRAHQQNSDGHASSSRYFYSPTKSTSPATASPIIEVGESESTSAANDIPDKMLKMEKKKYIYKNYIFLTNKINEKTN